MKKEAAFVLLVRMLTMQLSHLFTDAGNQLKTLDDLIEGDADDDSAEFVSNYFIMRRTVNCIVLK